MLRAWREWRRRRLLARYAIDDALWSAALADSPLFDRLTGAERAQLRDLTALFLAEKRFFGTYELIVDDYMRVSVASRACLLILGLDLDWYRGWRTVVIYPEGFVAERAVEDEIGVVHTGLEALDGESMYGGAVVLNWEEARPVRDDCPADVVLHEFAHKLDEANGEANGLPPLHPGMSVAEWSRVFTDAYQALNALLDADPEGFEDAELPLDDYAATHPAEFFAVATESFFLEPGHLRLAMPEVYRQLAAFYRQDPARSAEAARG